jgi:hypothetical protein
LKKLETRFAPTNRPACIKDPVRLARQGGDEYNVARTRFPCGAVEKNRENAVLSGAPEGSALVFQVDMRENRYASGDFGLSDDEWETIAGAKEDPVPIDATILRAALLYRRACAPMGFWKRNGAKLVKDDPGVLKIRNGRKKCHTAYSVPATAARRIRTRLDSTLRCPRWVRL